MNFNVESSKPSKQRGLHYNMPLHRLNKALSSNLDKKLRGELEMRSLPLRKGDTVKIVRGSKKGKTGKIARIHHSKRQVFIEGVNRKKSDGTEILVPLQASNLAIIEIDRSDERRVKGKKIKKAKKGKAEEKASKKGGK